MKPKNSPSRQELFEKVPIPKALATLAIPTIISQIINLVYNMVDAFFIGRTGNSYMMAATTLTLTLMLMNIAFGNLFGIGGGSLVARLSGRQKTDEARCVSAFSFYGAIAIALAYSLAIGLFCDPLLNFLGASADTIVYARQYTLLVIVCGNLPGILSATVAHLLRNVGCARQASVGLSSGGILNMALDPLFMFVLLPPGYEVMGAALATLLSNIFSCVYLLIAFRKAAASAPLSIRPADARAITRENIRGLFAVGIPSAILTGLFDLANVVLNMLAAAHSDLVLAAMGIVMKIERIPNAINVGICQGMLPLVAYNYSAGNRDRMSSAIRAARLWGLTISAVSIVLLEIFAAPVTRLFLSTSAGNADTALLTIGFAVLFLRLRCPASPVQFINYHTSYCMQAVGNGKNTMLHAVVRELVFYIPLMYIMDRIWAETGLALALLTGEALAAVFALWLLGRTLKQVDHQK